MLLQKAVQEILKMTGTDQVMIPVASIYDARNIHLLSLVKIKKSRWFPLFREKYHPIQIELNDLLLGTDVIDFGSIKQKDFVKVAIEREVGVSMDIQGGALITNVNGEAQLKVDKSSTIPELKLEQVSQKVLDIVKSLENSKINEDVIQRLSLNSESKLGLVYEIIRSSQPLFLQRNAKGEGSLKFIFAELAKCGASANRMVKEKLVLAEGSTLAFRVLPLTWGDNLGLAKCTTHQRILNSPSSNFKVTKEKVKEDLSLFGDMSQEVRKCLRDLLYGLLACPQVLSSLHWMLEEGQVDEDSLGSMREEVRVVVTELLSTVGLLPAAAPSQSNDLIHPVGLLVCALVELDEEALSIIAGLQPVVLGDLLHLVEDVLEKVYGGEMAAPQWRQQYSDKTWMVAGEALQACGLNLAKDQLDPSLGAQGDPDTGLIVFYIVLHGLEMLCNQKS